jgi:hypothetical protein
MLPKAAYVTPEWRTLNRKGYVDLVVEFNGVMWFLELLVGGIGAEEHSKRFRVGGKYSPSLIPGSQYALIDFRQNVKVRKEKDSFMYVSFSDGYRTARIKSNEEVKTVMLSA